jgi:hypothetical protein
MHREERRGTRDDAVAVGRYGWRLCPLAKAMVRASRMAGKAKASSTDSQTPLACHDLRARRPLMATNGPKSSRCWMPCTSARGNRADHANGSRSSRQRKGMTPKLFAIGSGNAGSEPRGRNGRGRPASRAADRSYSKPLASTPSARVRGSKESTAAWSFAGNVSRLASTRFPPSP